ncbi:hypothetical protein D3C79_849100 [compost metagenome]
MLQGFVLVTLGPVADAFVHMPQHLPGHVCQQQGAHHRHEQTGQGQQTDAGVFQCGQAHRSRLAIHASRGNRHKHRVVLDTTRLPAGHIDEPLTIGFRPARLQVWLGITQAHSQQSLETRPIMQSDALQQSMLKCHLRQLTDQSLLDSAPIRKTT